MKDIEFIAQSEYIWNVRPKPEPASKFLPEWWKNIPSYTNKEFNLDPGPNATVKRCVPTLDALTTGYIVSLPADCQVVTENGIQSIKWYVDSPVFDGWSPEQVSSYELTEGYGPTVFKFAHGWTIKTPKGWSSYITHPVGHQNLPFRAISGIVDTDKLDYEINTPIVFKSGWSGILEKGTPMFQIIPFERSSWKASYSYRTKEEHSYERDKLYSKIKGAYSKYLREKRSFT